MSELTVGIDARKIRDFGIGRYVEGLVEEFATSEPGMRFVLFLPREGREAIPPALRARLDEERFRTVILDVPLYSLREIIAFAGAAGRHGLDVLHFPHYVSGIAAGCPLVVTIHDVTHLKFPPSRLKLVYARAMMGWSAKRARIVLTGTQASREDLMSHLGLDPSRIRLTPYGVGPAFRPPGDEEVARFRERRGLTDPFVLCVASHRPHKNLAGALEGFGRSGLGDETEILIPARDPESSAPLRPLLEGTEKARLLHGVTDEELPLLYRAARIVLAPSLSEGFGLPPLEAAACGATVLASAIPPHLEVLGDAAVFFDPASADDLASSLTRVWHDSRRREEVAARGPERAREFSWTRTAALTAEAYREATGR